MDTKIKALILLLFSAFTTFAQTPGINFAAKFNITSATGGDPYNITGIVLDDLSRFTGSDVQVNDSIYVIDGDQLYVLAVTSITSVVGPTVTLVANDPNNAGVSIPTGQAAICRPTDNYKLPLYISGLRDDLRSMVMNRQAQLIDDINGSAVSAITDFTSAGVNVPPSPAASLNGGETWRNMTTGELWGSDGNVWYPYTRGPKECQDTVLVSAITVQSGGSVTTGSPLIRNSSGVWEHMYNHPSGLNLIPDGVVTDIIVGGKAIVQYCGVRKGSGATPNTSYYVNQSISTGFTTTKPTTNIRPLGKVASNGDFLVNAGLLFVRDNFAGVTKNTSLSGSGTIGDTLRISDGDRGDIDITNQGRTFKLDTLGATTGQTLKWNGSAWLPANVLNNLTTDTALYNVIYKADNTLARQLVRTYNVYTRTDIISTVPGKTGDYIFVENTKASYIIQTDSVAGYPTDGVAVIQIASGKYAVLLPSLQNDVHARWFDAIPDDGIEDDTKIQKAINYSVVRKYSSVLFGRGTYKLTKGVVVFKDFDRNGVFEFVTLAIKGAGNTYLDSGYSTVFSVENNSGFAIAIQLSRQCVVENIRFLGTRNYVSGYENTIKYTDSQWNQSGTYRDNLNSPYSGIVIDPFHSSVTSGNRYPDFTSYYTSHTGADGSSHIQIRGCHFTQLLVGIMNNPSVGIQNGDNIMCENSTVSQCKIFWAAGQDQSRDNTIKNVYSVGGIKSFMDGRSYGTQTGTLPVIELCNLAGGMKNIYTSNSGGRADVRISNTYAESIWQIGVGLSINCHVVNSTIKLDIGGSYFRPAYLCEDDIIFVNCNLMNYGGTTNAPMPFFGRVSFIGGAVIGGMVVKTFTNGPGETAYDISFLNTRLSAIQGNNKSFSTEIPSAFNIPAGNIPEQKIIFGHGSFTAVGADTKFERIPAAYSSAVIGSVAVTVNPTNFKATFKAPKPSILKVGDVIFTLTNYTIVDQLSTTSRSPALGSIESIGADSTVTISFGPEFSSGTYTLQAWFYDTPVMPLVGNVVSGQKFIKITASQSLTPGQGFLIGARYFGPGIVNGSYVTSRNVDTLFFSEPFTSTVTGGYYTTFIHSKTSYGTSPISSIVYGPGDRIINNTTSIPNVYGLVCRVAGLGAAARFDVIPNIISTTATPEGSITAPLNSLAISTISSTSDLWMKRTGTGNTGWGKYLNLLDALSASTNQVLSWNGTNWVPSTNLGNTSWQLTGNTVTAGTQFLGSTNNVSLRFRTNNVQRAMIDSTGNFGVGGIPTEKLDVTGNIKFSGALMPNNTAGTSGQVLTSAGASTVPTWVTPTYESTSVGAFNATGNSNGLSLTGTALSLHAATISTPGGVNVGQQTFGVGSGTKLFNGTGSGQITVDGNTDNTVAGINFTQQGTDLMGIVHMNSSDADNAQLRLALEQDGGLVDQMTIGTLNDSKGMYSRNGLYEDITTVTTSPYTVLYGDRNIYLDGTTITVNLQAIGTSTAETKIGRVIYFFNDNATNVTITPNGSETINDSASLTLLPNTGVTLLAVTGTKWVTRD